MPEIVTACPLCEGTASVLFDKRQFRGYQVINRECVVCGFVFQSPRMTGDELGEYYRTEYRRMYQGQAGPGEADLAIQEKRAESLLNFIEDSHQGGVRRHLDIGCSAGSLLEESMKKFGSQGIGIEPGESYREYARQRGLVVYPSLEAMAEAGEARFDLISLAHVLEHLPEPVAYLEELRKKYLTPEGRVLIEVPNLYAHDCFEVAHLSAFSPHTLCRTLAKAGFSVASIRKHGQPRSELLPLYLTVFARPSGARPPSDRDYISRERGVKLRRQLGMFRRRVMERVFPRQAWVSAHINKG